MTHLLLVVLATVELDDLHLVTATVTDNFSSHLARLYVGSAYFYVCTFTNH